MHNSTGSNPSHLSLTLPGTFVLTTDPPSTHPRAKTLEEIELSPEVQQFFANPRLISLSITCNEGIKYVDKGFSVTKLFTEFSEWFGEECARRGRKIELKVKICPREGWEEERNPELSWYTDGAVTSYFYQDFFG